MINSRKRNKKKIAAEINYTACTRTRLEYFWESAEAGQANFVFTVLGKTSFKESVQ